MALPRNITQTLDGGIGVTSPATLVAHCMGVAEGALLAANVPTLIANPRVLKEQLLDHSPLGDLVGFILSLSGGPVVVTRLTSGVPASFGTGNTTTAAMVGSAGAGVDNEINLAVATSAPKNDFDLRVFITIGGVRAATRFQYSLDGGLTKSPELVAAASVALGTSGVTLEFEAAATAPYVAGAQYSAQVNAPHFTSVNLQAGYDAAELSLLQWDYFVEAGDAITSAAGALLFATGETQMDSYVTQFDRFFGRMQNSGRDIAATAITAYAAAVGERSLKAYSNFVVPAPLPVVGRGFAKMPAVNRYAQLASANVMSTDLACTAGASSVGAIPGCQRIGHDEFLNEAGLDTAKFATLRTWPNKAGFFTTNGWLSAGAGSDFQYWQHRIIMDKACRTVSAVHTDLSSQNFTVKGDGSGSLTEDAAQSIEKKAQRQLDTVIGSSLRAVGPTRLDGKVGHVSEVVYQVDRTNNFLSTGEIIATISLIPLGYAKIFRQTFAFKAQVT